MLMSLSNSETLCLLCQLSLCYPHRPPSTHIHLSTHTNTQAYTRTHTYTHPDSGFSPLPEPTPVYRSLPPKPGMLAISWSCSGRPRPGSGALRKSVQALFPVVPGQASFSEEPLTQLTPALPPLPSLTSGAAPVLTAHPLRHSFSSNPDQA